MATNKDNSLIILIGAGLGLALFAMGDKKQTIPTTAQSAGFTGGATDFITKTYLAAKEAEKITGVPAMVALLFAGLESGFGKHAPANNFFGIKTGSQWTGKKQLLTTTEILPKPTGYKFPAVISVVPQKGKYKWTVKDNFRAYDTLQEAFIDYGKFVKGGRYKNAFNNTEPLKIVEAIYKSGYATDPTYMVKMTKLYSQLQSIVTQNFH